MPCLRRLLSALSGSHTKRVSIHKCYYINVAIKMLLQGTFAKALTAKMPFPALVQKK